MMYNIKLDHFEGPLDLLLRLIEEQQMDITRVSLSRVADQYLQHIESNRDITLEQLSGFLVVATRLILLKSKALLPVLDLTDEEEEEIEDLEWRLAEYKKFKESAKVLKSIIESGSEMFVREAYFGVRDIVWEKENLPNISVQDIQNAFARVLQSIPDPKKLKEKIIRRVLSLEDKIFQIQVIISERTQCVFSDIIAEKKDKTEIIVAFLAVLELVKRRILCVEQKTLWSEIRVISGER